MDTHATGCGPFDNRCATNALRGSVRICAAKTADPSPTITRPNCRSFGSRSTRSGRRGLCGHRKPDEDQAHAFWCGRLGFCARPRCFSFRSSIDLRTGPLLVITEPKQSVDFGKRDAEFLRALHETAERNRAAPYAW